jgi:hypothetical protein
MPLFPPRRCATTGTRPPRCLCAKRRGLIDLDGNRLMEAQSTIELVLGTTGTGEL